MRWTLSGLLLLVTTVQATPFTYDGVGLRSDFKTVAARFPHSTPSDGYVRLAPEDVHDHISAIEVSGTGPITGSVSRSSSRGRADVSTIPRATPSNPG